MVSYKKLVEAEVRKWSSAHESWKGSKYQQDKCEKEFYYWLNVLYNMQ